MNARLILASLAALGFATGGWADSRVKIDSVPPTYSPQNNPVLRDPVSLAGYQFEINPERTRARLVVNYTYPDAVVYRPNDDNLGPRPTVVQLPGLTYDVAAHALIYNVAGQKTVCATVSEKTGVFGSRLVIKKTGACTVSTVLAKDTDDDGWTTHRVEALDVYLNLH